MIHMDAKAVGIGTFVLLLVIFIAVVVTPTYTNQEMGEVSANYRQRTELEEQGRALYISYGCQYCHSQYVRTVDWGLGAERLAQAGDYARDTAPQLGSLRNGPDLSQAGGEHTDDWHVAHFYNPRFTRPESIMPAFSYFAEHERDAMIAYVQSLGGKEADARVKRQWYWRNPAIEAYEAGVDENIIWLHANVPRAWLDLPNPYPQTDVSFKRGETVYQRHCLGCHGPVGDGQGPASAFVYPPPLNFTTLRRHARRYGLSGGVSGGMLYYQIMNGITGTAMPYFKRELESEKIWDVANYVAYQFIDVTDADRGDEGIDAAFEPVDHDQFDTPPKSVYQLIEAMPPEERPGATWSPRERVDETPPRVEPTDVARREGEARVSAVARVAVAISAARQSVKGLESTCAKTSVVCSVHGGVTAVCAHLKQLCGDLEDTSVSEVPEDN